MGIKDDDIVVMFCHPETAAALIDEEPEVAEAVVMSVLIPQEDIVVTPREEFLNWLYEDEPKTGKWLWELADNGWADHICSECGWKLNTDVHVSIDYRYCPNCGSYNG